MKPIIKSEFYWQLYMTIIIESQRFGNVSGNCSIEYIPKGISMLVTPMGDMMWMCGPGDILNGVRHDDVIKWKHFPRYWPFVRGIHRSPVNSQHKGQWRRALMFLFFYLRPNNVWVNNCEAGDLRHHRAHHDVIVMGMEWYFEGQKTEDRKLWHPFKEYDNANPY